MLLSTTHLGAVPPLCGEESRGLTATGLGSRSAVWGGRALGEEPRVAAAELSAR